METKDKKSKFLVYCPMTGLGLFAGFRGNRWYRNRLKILKQFVIPSLLNQTDRDFVFWMSFREEERNNPHTKELEAYLQTIPNFPFLLTFTGVFFWDDKYPEDIARERLFRTLQYGLPKLFDCTSDAEEIHWLLQPSDDCYHKETIASVKKAFQDPEMQAVGYTKGYICNYTTKEVLEYNPRTTPPFFAIKFSRQTFFDPGKHMNYTGPFQSHEYIGDKLKMAYFEGRGFLVGTHTENISTHFNHPYGGAPIVEAEKELLLESFGLSQAPPLDLPWSFRKWLMRKLPHRVRRKLRYWGGEVIGNRLYNWVRS